MRSTSGALCGGHPRNFHDRATDATHQAISNGPTAQNSCSTVHRHGHTTSTGTTGRQQSTQYPVISTASPRGSGFRPSSLGCKILTTSARIFWLKIIYFKPPIVSATSRVHSQSEAHARTHHTSVMSFVVAFPCSVTRRPCPRTVEPLPPCRWRPEQCTMGAFICGWLALSTPCSAIIVRTPSTPSSAHHVECCCPSAIIALASAPSTAMRRHTVGALVLRCRRPQGTLDTLIRRDCHGFSTGKPVTIPTHPCEHRSRRRPLHFPT